MNDGDISFAAASLLVDEFARAGVRCAAIAPGSRSTPLALALARQDRIVVGVHLDERAAAYHALGRARADGVPCLVVTTSGTAAANVFPAVVEASMAGVPLIVVTADRPPELRDAGANQTIDQTKLFGSYVRWFFEPGVPTADAGTARAWRRMGAHAISRVLGPPAGPVHLNCAFREPLIPSGASVDLGPEAAGRANGQPWQRHVAAVPLPQARDIELLAGQIAAAEEGVIVCGGSSRGGEWVARLAERAGWPLVAEPHSGARVPPHASTAGPALLADEGFTRAHQPSVVLQFGSAPTSRATSAFVARARRVIVVEADGRPADPTHHASSVVHADPDALSRALLDLLPSARETAWLKAWRSADHAARAALDVALDAWDDASELRVARDLTAALPDGATLVVASSMPIRDLDMTMAPRTGVRVLANRGASGIDGFVSTVFGVASAGAPTFALAGDLSILHDAGGLLWGARDAADATFVVLNNGGGGIFDLLSQATLPELDRYFVAAHALDLRAIANAAGIAYGRVERAREVVSAVLAPRAEPAVVDVAIDRKRAVELRRAVRDAVARALA